MALKHRCASPGKHVIYTSEPVGACSCEFISCAVEAGIKHLVIVTAESLNTLTAADIPKLACPVDRTSQTVVSSKVKLSARELSLVAFQREDALARANIPNLCCVVERGREQLVSIRVKAE